MQGFKEKRTCVVFICFTRPSRGAILYFEAEERLGAEKNTGCNMNDEIAQDIAKELRLIREELQKLSSAVKSIASRPQNSNKSGRSYQERNSLPFEHRPPDRKQQAVRRPEDKRRQWHLPRDAK
jgi:hypothetical protein